MVRSIAKRPRNMLSGRYGLGEMSRRRKGGISPTAVNIGITTAGMVLGLITYQYRNDPIGATLLVAAGSIVGVGLVFFAKELLETV